MNLTVHIVKKDFRRLLVPLALWALLLVAQIFLGIRMLRGDGDNLEWFGRMSLYGYLFFALDLVVSYVLVAMLIHEDPLTGSQEFWLTRPISGGRLLAAKSLGAVLMFGVLPVAIWLPWWLACGYGWHDVAAAVFETLILKFGVVLPALLLAVLTEHFSRYLTWTLAAIMLLFLLDAFVNMALSIHPPSWQGLANTRVCLTLLVTAMGVAAVVCHQFLTRHTVRSFVLSGVGFVLVALSIVLWPWDLSQVRSEPAAPPSAIGDQISISVDQIKITQPEAGIPGAGVTFEMTARGVPDGLGLVGYWSGSIFRSRHIWRWPDGYTLDLSQYVGFASFEDWMDGAVRRLLGVPGLKPDSRRNELIIANQQKMHEGRRLATGLNLPIQAAARMVKEPPAYTGQFNLLLIRPEVEYELPLGPSDRQRHGTTSLRIAWTGVREDGRMFVNLVESKPDPRTDSVSYDPSASRPYPDWKEDVLINRARNEAMLIPGWGSNQATRIGTVEIRWNTLAFPAPLEQRDGQWVPEPATWFDGATFVRTGFVEETRFSREVKMERFEATP